MRFRVSPVRALAVAGLFVLVTAPTVPAHCDGVGGKQTQTSRVTEVWYFIDDPAWQALLDDQVVTYDAIVSETGHGTQTHNGYVLTFNAPMPAAAYARNDLVWVHHETIPMAAPLKHQFDVNFRVDTGGLVPGPFLLESHGPSHLHGASGTYGDLWDLWLLDPVTNVNVHIGYFRVTHVVTIVNMTVLCS